jgi:hypothetical protein
MGVSGLKYHEITYFQNQKVTNIFCSNYVAIFLTEKFENVHFFEIHLESEPFDKNRSYHFKEISNVLSVNFSTNFIYFFNDGLKNF